MPNLNQNKRGAMALPGAPPPLFHPSGKGVQRMQPGRMIAAGHYPSLPTAHEDFLGAHAVTADGDWVCQKIGAAYVWVKASGG